MDPNSDEGRLTLFSFVRPDQPERLALLRGALAIGQSVLAVVDAAGAEEWLVHVLAEPRPGCATVVFQSIVWQYLDTAQRQRIAEAMAEAGARAASRAPLAWLRMEPEGAVTTLQARLLLVLHSILATMLRYGRMSHPSDPERSAAAPRVPRCEPSG